MTLALVLLAAALLLASHYLAWRAGRWRGYHDCLNEPHPPWLQEAVERVREDDSEREMFVRPASDTDREH